jgi:uncharacterized RDD family membrane protein YckC
VEIQGRPYCADCKAEQLLDVRSGVDSSQITLASRWRRLGALIIDWMLLGIPWAIVKEVFKAAVHISPTSLPFVMLSDLPLSVGFVIYEAVMLYAKEGQTVGKMALGIRVVRPDGSSLTNGQAWGRAALRFVLGCLIIVDYIPAFFTVEKTTLHDMIAETRVVDKV